MYHYHYHYVSVTCKVYVYSEVVRKVIYNFTETYTVKLYIYSFFPNSFSHISARGQLSWRKISSDACYHSICLDSVVVHESYYWHYWNSSYCVVTAFNLEFHRGRTLYSTAKLTFLFVIDKPWLISQQALFSLLLLEMVPHPRVRFGLCQRYDRWINSNSRRVWTEKISRFISSDNSLFFLAGADDFFGSGADDVGFVGAVDSGFAGEVDTGPGDDGSAGASDEHDDDEDKEGSVKISGMDSSSSLISPLFFLLPSLIDSDI